MPSPKKPKRADDRTRKLKPRPEHLVGQSIIEPGSPDQKRRELFRIRVGRDDKVCVFGKSFPDTEEWAFRRFRWEEGQWTQEESKGLRILPDSVEHLRDGLIRESLRLGFAAPIVGFEYQAERYRAEVAAGDDEAIVPHLVLKALAMAWGNGDREAAGRMGRDALKYIRAVHPEFVALGDGEGLLEQKGDSGRNQGKERILRVASGFCREQEEEIDCEEAANRLGDWVEKLHPKAYRAAMRAAVDAARASGIAPELIPSAHVEMYAQLERDLERQVDPTPEAIARLVLSSFGVSEDKVRHYFDYRFAGVNRAHSGTLRISWNGEAVHVYRARPEKVSKPSRAVIVLPEMFGVNDQAQQVARRLARAGYLAIVPHFLRATIPPSRPVERLTVLSEAGRSLRAKAIHADLAVALGYLEKKHQINPAQVAMVGFEAGAAALLDWLETGDRHVGAAVAFYGAGALSRSGLHSPLLAFVGDRDPWFTEPRRAELRATLESADNGSRLETFVGAERGFFEPGFVTDHRKKRPPEPPTEDPGHFNLELTRFYHPAASRDAWDLMIKFLGEHLGS